MSELAYIVLSHQYTDLGCARQHVSGTNKNFALLWYTGLPVRHGLPNPMMVCTNERTRSISPVIAKLSYVLFYWSKPHAALAIHAIMRGWVSRSYFLQLLLISSYVLLASKPFWKMWRLLRHLKHVYVNAAMLLEQKSKKQTNFLFRMPTICQGPKICVPTAKRVYWS